MFPDGNYIIFVANLAPKLIEVNIDGDGILADLYKTIIHTFRPVTNEMRMDMTSCLPNPLPPDYDIYERISKTTKDNYQFFFHKTL